MKWIRRSWLQLAGAAGIGRVFGFASNLFLSRLLGPAELGLFNLVTTTVQTSDTLVRCGGDYALNYELGGEPEASHTEAAAKLVQGLSQICSLMTLVVCSCVAIWVFLGKGLFPQDNWVVSLRFPLGLLLLLMIAAEGICASAWEVLLVTRKTSELALRQGLFFPLRLLLAAICAWAWGILGAMIGWSLVAILQCLWLKVVLKKLWNPLKLLPAQWHSARCLLKRGLPFYASNIIASIVFYPLLLQVASKSGLEEIGYLRVGQVMQQVFAFLPATLVPILFLELRGQNSFRDQVRLIEKPLKIIWLLLLEVILIYYLFDGLIVQSLFGYQYVLGLNPTRFLLLTSLIECITQIAVQPLLASGLVRMYGVWQNLGALLSALLGFYLIPSFGLAGYLLAKLCYVLVPFIRFGTEIARSTISPFKFIPYASTTLAVCIITASQEITGYQPNYLIASTIIVVTCIYLLISEKDLIANSLEMFRS